MVVAVVCGSQYTGAGSSHPIQHLPPFVPDPPVGRVSAHLRPDRTPANESSGDLRRRRRRRANGSGSKGQGRDRKCLRKSHRSHRQKVEQRRRRRRRQRRRRRAKKEVIFSPDYSLFQRTFFRKCFKFEDVVFGVVNVVFSMSIELHCILAQKRLLFSFMELLVLL